MRRMVVMMMMMMINRPLKGIIWVFWAKSDRFPALRVPKQQRGR